MLKRHTVTSQVIEYILELIRKGKMVPGDKLPTEQSLTKTLGESRTCVREAVKSLESLHVISVRPRVGAVLLPSSQRAFFSAEHLVEPIRAEESNSLIDFRVILESGLASLAAKRASEADLLTMPRATQSHQNAIDTVQRRLLLLSCCEISSAVSAVLRARVSRASMLLVRSSADTAICSKALAR